MKPSLKELFEQINTGFPGLRPWQEHFSELWNKYSNKTLYGISPPTGSGKTLVGLLILAQGIRNGKRCVYLTHTKQQMDRVATEAEKLNLSVATFGGAKGVRGDDFKQRKRDIFDYSRKNKILISNFDTFLYTSDFPEEIDWLVLDDADLFLSKIREYFIVKIKNEKHTKDAYVKILKALDKTPYPIIQKIRENTAKFEDGDIIFPFEYAVIKEVIQDEMENLQQDLNFKTSYQVSQDILPFYAWFLKRNSLTLEPYIVPTIRLKTPNGKERFKPIEKIILMSATLGTADRVRMELGLDGVETQIFTEQTFQQEGITIDTGERMIFPISDEKLHPNPLSEDFITTSLEFIQKIVMKFRKVLILCWKNAEKKQVIRSLKKIPKSPSIFDFQGKNVEIFEEFSEADEGILLIAHRYFGLDFPEESCKVCILTRLPTFLNPFDIIVKEFQKDLFYFYELEARRVIQALGRLNRGKDDRSVYFVLDPRFQSTISSQSEFHPFLSPQLAQTIEYCVEKTGFDFIESIKLGKSFLQASDKLDLSGIKDPRDTSHYSKERQIMDSIQKLVLEGWTHIYGARIEKGIKKFTEAVDILASERNISPEHRRKIEWFQFLTLLAYFYLEEKGRKDYIKLVDQYCERVGGSRELTWLNRIQLQHRDGIKVQDINKEEEKNPVQKKFRRFLETPELFLGDLLCLPEVVDSINVIKEILSSLADKLCDTPMRSMAVEFEKILKKTLQNREEMLYNRLDADKKLDVGNILSTLYSNGYLQKETFQELNAEDNTRGLRNSIIHTKDNFSEITYPQAVKICEDLKVGLEKFFRDVICADQIRNNKELAEQLGNLEEFEYQSADMILLVIIQKWKEGKITFSPPFGESDLTSYSGDLEIISKGEQYTFPIEFELKVP